MRKLGKPSAVSAGLLVAFLAAFVLLGFGTPRTETGVRADASVVPAAAVPAVSAATVCVFNMSWDGTGCR